jgi:integrase
MGQHPVSLEKPMPLSDAEIRQLKPTDRAQKHFDGKGLYLEVTPSGAKYWRLKYRFAGKENRISLGVYPEVGLKAARAATTTARALLAKGTDPSQQRRIDKETANIAAENTFEALAREWHRIKAHGWSTSHADSVMQRMTNNLFPWIGKRPLAGLEAPELLATLRRIESRGAVETAHRCQMIMSMVFRFAFATGRATRNPAADVGAGLTVSVASGNHPAIVAPVRFGQMLRDIDCYGGNPVTMAALKMHALTFQRPNEVSGMAWAELDLDEALWTIPATRMKRKLVGKANGIPHLVPLSKQAIQVLNELRMLTGKGPLVFPSERGQGRSISENTARQALRSMGYTDHCPHGFRATARTLIHEQLHIKKEVVERAIAHGSDEVMGGSYDRTQFFMDRVKMMQAWADYLDKLRIGADVIS